MGQTCMSNVALADLLQADLLNGERVLWTGHPQVNAHFTRADGILIPFSVLWQGFILYALAQEISKGTFGTSIIEVIIFILLNVIGLYLVVGRFAYKVMRKRRTLFAVTNRRALTVTDFFGRQVDAVFLSNVPISRIPGGWGSRGGVKFGESKWSEETYANTGLDILFGIQSSGAPLFFDLEDPDAVCKLAKDQLNDVIDPRDLTGRLRRANSMA